MTTFCSPIRTFAFAGCRAVGFAFSRAIQFAFSCVFGLATSLTVVVLFALVGCVAEKPANTAASVSEAPPVVILLAAGQSGRAFGGKKTGMMAWIKDGLLTLDAMMGKGTLAIRELDVELNCTTKDGPSCQEQARVIIENSGADALIYVRPDDLFYVIHRYRSVRPTPHEVELSRRWTDFIPFVESIVDAQALAQRDARSRGRLEILERGLLQVRARQKFAADASGDLRATVERSLGDVHYARALSTQEAAEFSLAVAAYDRAIHLKPTPPYEADFWLRSAVALEAQGRAPVNSAILLQARNRYARAASLRIASLNAQAIAENKAIANEENRASGKGLLQDIFDTAELGVLRCDATLAISKRSTREVESVLQATEKLIAKKKATWYVWAEQQSALCDLQLARAELADAPPELRNTMFEQAANSCRDAASAYKKALTPALFAQSRSHFADVMSAWATSSGSPRIWELAAKHYGEALGVIEPEFYPQEWPLLQYKWARALIEHGVSERLNLPLEQGLDALKSAESKVPHELTKEISQLEARAKQALSGDLDAPTNGVTPEVVEPEVVEPKP